MKQLNPMIEALKIEVQKNPCFKDIMHMLSLRQRTRGRLTVTRLKTAMEEEGFNYSRPQYEEVLKILGKLGVGQLVISTRGKVKALNNIKIKLQSIGQAALTQDGTIKQRHEVSRYESLLPVQEQMHQASFIETSPKVPKVMPQVRAEEPLPVFLTMLIGGRPVNIPGPSNVTAENFAEFIIKFKGLNGDVSK